MYRYIRNTKRLDSHLDITGKQISVTHTHIFKEYFT